MKESQNKMHTCIYCAKPYKKEDTDVWYDNNKCLCIRCNKEQLDIEETSYTHSYSISEEEYNWGDMT